MKTPRIDRRLLLVPVLLSLLLATVPAARAADEPAYVPTVLVTGANRGIGLEYIRQYGARGWNVIATARKPAEAAELNALAATNPRIAVEQLDVSDYESIDALARKYAGKPVDVLVNNAGITGNARAQVLGKLNWPEFEQILKTNTIGPLKMVEAFLPSIEASRQKKIVNVSSSEGSIGSVIQGRTYFYRASKAALNMEMKNLAAVLAPKGIAVAMINPGPVDTDMMAGMPKSALRTKEDSVADLIRITDRLTVGSTGVLWNWSGEQLPW
jgi:NAD(P)-dependent dehydrogenase (short-subunit alcohol dehydrogenase family)